MFEIGKRVVSLSDFEDVRKIWGFNYPYRGDILTIRDIKKHHRHNFLLLYFDGIPIGLCDKNFAPLEDRGETMIEEIVCENVLLA